MSFSSASGPQMAPATSQQAAKNAPSGKINNRSADDDVSIKIGGRKLAGWQAVTITRSAEQFPNAFSFRMTDEFSNDPGTILAIPGDGVAQVFIGEDLVVTGYVDRYEIGTAPGSHEVSVTGRGLCEDLVDCSIDLLDPKSAIVNGQVAAANALDLAKKLCAAFNIPVRSAVSDLGRPIITFQVAAGETPFEVIERVCRYAGYLIYEDEFGQLVLDRVGTLKMASGFGVENVEGAQSTLSMDQRFSDYCVIWGTVSQVFEGAGSNTALKRATAVDKGVKDGLKRYRPRIVQSAQFMPGEDLAQRMANWEMARRRGRSQAVHLTCDSWRDSAGQLWRPNRLAPVHLPQHKIVGAEWIIGDVTFRRDAGGTHADLTLMPPEAYSVQPAALQLWDFELVAGSPGASPDGNAP